MAGEPAEESDTRPHWITSVLVLAMFSLSGQALATPLSVTDGLIYQLDATDSANLQYDPVTGAITSWTSSQGSASGFALAAPSGSVTYSAAGGGNTNLPNVVFGLGSKLVQTAGGGTTPKTVFIMENTTAITKYGGIFGRNGGDRGIRFNNDNPAEGSIFGGPAVVGTNLYENLGPVVAGGTHQLINGVSTTVDAIAYNPADPYSLNPYTPYRKSITTAFDDFGINDQGTNQGGTYTENYYWSDTTIADGRQTWQNKNWGTLAAYAYDTYPYAWTGSGDRATTLGSYYQADIRKWAGSIGEVLVYDRWLSDAERQSVETYLKSKWLASASAANFTATPPGPFDFGTTGVSTISAVQTVTLTNGGDLAGDVTGAGVTGGFVFSTVPGTPTYSVAGGGTAVYGIQLPPQTLPGSYSGVATFTTASGVFTYNLSATVIAHDGDVNGDGQVSLLDYNIIKVNFGNVYEGGTHWADGDLNADGQVGLLDFNIVKAHFGHTTGDIGVTAVPEPATLSLLALAGLAALRRRRN